MFMEFSSCIVGIKDSVIGLTKILWTGQSVSFACYLGPQSKKLFVFFSLENFMGADKSVGKVLNFYFVSA